MALSITVILPVVQVKMAEDLIKQIEENTVVPERIILIDNSKDGFYPESKIPTTRIRRKKPPMGVNESWTVGISLAQTDLLSIFNDDICISPYLFEKIERTMRALPDCAVACPFTVDNIDRVRLERKEEPYIDFVDQREGWAFTIRKSVSDKIPKIPKELKTFFGDDWYWYHTGVLGFYWVRVQNSYVFHHGGSSMREMGIGKRERQREREEFFRLVTE